MTKIQTLLAVIAAVLLAIGATLYLSGDKVPTDIPTQIQTEAIADGPVVDTPDDFLVVSNPFGTPNQDIVFAAKADGTITPAIR